MPSPPPPPPPPPPPSGQGPPAPSPARSKLLSEIHAGAKLRKTITNDRSAPMIGGNAGNAGSGIRGGMSGPQGLQIPTGSGGGLFANGLPKKPSDNKKVPVLPPGSLATNKPSLPQTPKSQTSSLGDRPRSPPPPSFPKPPNNRSDSPPPLPASKPPLIGPRSDSLGHISQRPPDAAHLNNVETSSYSLSGSIASRLEQLNMVSRSGLNAPTPPSAKAKPVLPIVPPVKKPSPPPQFQTMRPTRSNRNEAPYLRRTGSSEDLRNSPPPAEKPTPPPPPPNPPSASRITKPPCPPPPPPSQPPRAARLGGASNANSNNNIGTPARNLNGNHFPLPPTFQSLNAADDDAPPPPPPPRGSSCVTDSMDRFTFIPISELPPPEVFSRTKKVYDHSNRRHAPVAPTLS